MARCVEIEIGVGDVVQEGGINRVPCQVRFLNMSDGLGPRDYVIEAEWSPTVATWEANRAAAYRAKAIELGESIPANGVNLLKIQLA